MKVLIINECTFESINSIGVEECITALKILDYLLNRRISLQEQQEVKSYINRINQRTTYLQQFKVISTPDRKYS